MRKRRFSGGGVLERKTEELAVNLSQEEVSERACRLAEIEGELEQHDEEARKVRTELKKKRTELEVERRRLALAVRTRSEMRLVDVTISAIWSQGVAEIARNDTGEVIGTRPLTDEDRQTDLLASNKGEGES